MKQSDAVYQAVQDQGGYATLGHLYHAALRVPGCVWKTKTPFHSIRRIVQEDPRFFKIKPGLWGLSEQRERILMRLNISREVSPVREQEFSHSYYQGLLTEIGNLKGYQTFIPRQDKNRRFLSQKLADVATLTEFQPFTYERLLQRGCTVDVTWFNDRGFPNAFFEVEHSTDIQNSLLKFLEFQDFRIKFRIVADAARRAEFAKKLSYSAFTPIQSQVEFIDYETVSNLHARVYIARTLEQSVGL